MPDATIERKDAMPAVTAPGPLLERRRVLQRLAVEVFDVLVVGGGVTGCGAALDAVSRGLTVALIEKRDIAAGTSSRSSKLIHGGLRYLERLDIGLVREALRERALLVEELAPHLVHPTRFLLPLRHGVRDRLYLGAGLVLYDILGGLHPALPRHRHLSHDASLRAVPSLRGDALTGGITYSDAQVDDARFAVALARTAAARGAALATALQVVGFLRQGQAIVGVRVRDLEGGEEFPVRSRVVVNCGGVWTTELERLAGVASPLQVRPSKGVHVVVGRSCIDSSLALILPTEKSVLFVLPWGGHWIIGTTDTDWRYGLDHPSATSDDIAYLLGHVNRVLRRPLTTADVTAAYAGLRPLQGGAAGDTARVSREHTVRRSAPGLVSVAGGKYTTYRLMARDVVDAAAADLPFAVAASQTASIPLLGAAESAQASQDARRHPGAAGLADEALRHLVERYGGEATSVLDLVRDDPGLGAPLTGAEDYLAAEVSYATRSESALHVDDVLSRRTHIAFEAPDRGRRAVEAVASLMAPLLGWDRARREGEVAHYRARLEAESAAQALPDDAASAAARAPVQDLRLLRR
jgi:glycerol-3-phosphate dehydrogenase